MKRCRRTSATTSTPCSPRKEIGTGLVFASRRARAVRRPTESWCRLHLCDRTPEVLHRKASPRVLAEVPEQACGACRLSCHFAAAAPADALAALRAEHSGGGVRLSGPGRLLGSATPMSAARSSKAESWCMPQDSRALLWDAITASEPGQAPGGVQRAQGPHRTVLTQAPSFGWSRNGGHCRAVCTSAKIHTVSPSIS